MALKSANQPIRWLQRIGTWIAAAGSFAGEVLKSFLNIKEEDGLLEKKKNAASFLARFSAYLTVDYFLAFVTPVIVAAIKYHGLSFPWVFLAVWVYGLVVAGSFVLFFEKTGEDLSVGVDLRRATDTLHKGSRIAGIIAITWFIVKAIFWTGPEQVVTFFRKEIGTIPRVIIVLLFLTALQSLIWAALYSLGYDLLAV